jgi:putative thioredoxin
MANAPFVIEVTDATFEQDVIRGSKKVPVVVDFWAPWCGPCRSLGPVLEKLAKEFSGGFILAKINTDENQQVAYQMGIQGIPAVKGFANGQIAAEFVGAQPEPQVRAFLEKLGVKKGSGTAEAAGPDPDELLKQGKYVEAEMAYRQAMQGNGKEPAMQLGYARALLAQGKVQEAQPILNNLNEGPEAVVAQTLKPLAALLMEVASGRDGGGEIDMRYHESGRLVARGDLRGAMDALIDVLRQDKRYRNGEPRQAVIAIFAVLGDENPLVREYRNKLASVLF